MVIVPYMIRYSSTASMPTSSWPYGRHTPMSHSLKVSPNLNLNPTPLDPIVCTCAVPCSDHPVPSIAPAHPLSTSLPHLKSLELTLSVISTTNRNTNSRHNSTNSTSPLARYLKALAPAQGRIYSLALQGDSSSHRLSKLDAEVLTQSLPGLKRVSLTGLTSVPEAALVTLARMSELERLEVGDCYERGRPVCVSDAVRRARRPGLVIAVE